MEIPKEPRKTQFPIIVVAAAIIVSILLGGLLGYSISYVITQGKINNLQTQIDSLLTKPNQNVSYFLGDNVSLSRIYALVKASVVVILDQQPEQSIFGVTYSQVQGSGFVYNYSGEIVVVTNYHVVQNGKNLTLTFSDGNTYSASIKGFDPYEDLAILSAKVPQNEWKPLQIVSSSTLEVGDPVIAVGSPYGLAGTMTVGIVSSLGRTLTETMTGGYPIASVIQTSTAINPGNSGGPLLNYGGQVVGITTAIVSNSQGLGFAIPSNAILREINSLATTGSYSQHPSLGIGGVDMTYDIAVVMHTNVTYGVLVESVSRQNGLQAGTSQVYVDGSLIMIGGDVIIAINQARITGLDGLSTYIEEYTLPGQTANLTVVRNSQTMTVAVSLGARSSPNGS
jgi:S1-C subfamily serine protease